MKKLIGECEVCGKERWLAQKTIDDKEVAICLECFKEKAYYICGCGDSTRNKPKCDTCQLLHDDDITLKILSILDKLKTSDEFHEWHKSIMGEDDILTKIVEKIKSEINNKRGRGD
jgi:CDGSH-type Zn-finger protein